MTYRPYPSPVRARHQVGRHVSREDVPALALPPVAVEAWAAIVEAFGSSGTTALPQLLPTPPDQGSER